MFGAPSASWGLHGAGVLGRRHRAAAQVERQRPERKTAAVTTAEQMTLPRIDPARFYTGLVAELYAPLRSSVPDPDVYAGFIRAVGEPALELGCGDGDPMIELRCRGVDVEGVDSSPEMLDRCRVAAARRGVEVVVHLQRMQDLDVARTFRCIYLAGATFSLLTTDDDATATLRRIREHLEPDGSALVPLFIPTPTEPLGLPVEATDSDGAVISVTPMSEWRDEERRLQQTVLRYERIADTGQVAEDRPWTLHWHSQVGFRTLAAAAGLRAMAVLNEHGEPASPEDSTFAHWLQPAR
jgi:hypothetical protein